MSQVWDAERRASYLQHQELHVLLLHLFNPADWRLDLDAFLASLQSELRELADEILANFRAGGRNDPDFVRLASSLETATNNFIVEHELQHPHA